MKLRLLRNASLLLEYGETLFMIDPMFSEQGANPPVFNTANDRRNPLVPLPVRVEELPQPDAVLLTHLHPDHWDEPAARRLALQTPIFCQPGQEQTISEPYGFTAVSAVSEEVIFQGVAISRTTGHHGTGEIGKLMGQVSGFVFKAEGEPVLYIAGDTIWCEDVKEAIDIHKPDIIVVNAGGAEFVQGGPIIMNEDDVVSVCRYAPQATVIAVHMEAINHCYVSREALRARMENEGLSGRVKIPQDGEWV